MSRRDFNRLAATLILGAVLAACTPEGQAQETRPAMTQTIDGLDVAGESEEAIVETITSTATPENTPTPEATSTPEATATPAAPEFPSDFIFSPRNQVEKGNPYFYDWGDGYRTISVPLYIRAQDAHYNEPFTMLNGRYHVQAWADAWFQEKDGTNHHMSIPLIVFDTENYRLFKYGYRHITDFLEQGANDWDLEVLLKNYTGPWSENPRAEANENQLAFNETGLYTAFQEEAFKLSLGAIPTRDINSREYKENIQDNVEFWRDLIKDIYTTEQIEAFTETLDVSLLSLDEPNLPANFIIPIRGNN